ncbi:F-box protein [Glycine max]|nr:F-box protein [Glycine max]
MGKDLFSNLPDQILCHIVSFLPNESSLETSLLSTRWRDLWNEALVKHGTQEDIIGVVADFITNFEEFDPLKHPRKLQFHFAEESVVSVTVANNSKLMLDFSPWKEEIPIGYELEFKLSKQHIATYQSFPSTFSVKTLHLKSVSCFTSEVAASIVSNLEHLENLVVIDCKGLESLSVDSTSELHKLTILDCLELKTLRLKTSKLKSFRYRGPLPLIRPEYHFNLSDAMLDFRLGLSCSGLKAKDFDATLLTIKNSEVLTLCKWTFENDPESYLAGGSNSCVVKGTKCTGMEHLKVIKFMGFSSRRDEISLAKCLIHMIKGKPPKIKTSDGNCLDAMFVE